MMVMTVMMVLMVMVVTVMMMFMRGLGGTRAPAELEAQSGGWVQGDLGGSIVCKMRSSLVPWWWVGHNIFHWNHCFLSQNLYSFAAAAVLKISLLLSHRKVFDRELAPGKISYFIVCSN